MSRFSFRLAHVGHLSKKMLSRRPSFLTLIGILIPVLMTLIFDPFADLNLLSSLELLAPFGRYVTCGFVEQYFRKSKSQISDYPHIQEVIAPIIAKNISVIGNCLGAVDDLTQGLRLLGRSFVPFDRAFSYVDIEGFIDACFVSRPGLGHVSFFYSS